MDRKAERVHRPWKSPGPHLGRPGQPFPAYRVTPMVTVGEMVEVGT
jgi:hypothetical protein